MTFEQTRRELIAYGVANRGNPALRHRIPTAIGILEKLQRPLSDKHRARLLRDLAKIMSEIEAIKANGGIFTPSMMRVAA